MARKLNPIVTTLDGRREWSLFHRGKELDMIMWLIQASTDIWSAECVTNHFSCRKIFTIKPEECHWQLQIKSVGPLGIRLVMFCILIQNMDLQVCTHCIYTQAHKALYKHLHMPCIILLWLYLICFNHYHNQYLFVLF